MYRFKNIVFLLFILRLARRSLHYLRLNGPLGSLQNAYQSFQRTAYGLFLNAPGVRNKVKSQIDEALTKLEEKMVNEPNKGLNKYSRIPEKGFEAEMVLQEMRRMADLPHSQWEDGMVSGAVYHGGKELLDLQTKAYGTFAVANPLHPDVFPGLRKMEAEVVAMVLSMYNAPPTATGVTTSGGTESILMAVLSARNKACKERGVTEPNIIVPKTIHAAFDKACGYFGIKIKHIPVDPVTFKVDLKAVARAITSNTILIAGSAPNFPHGMIDDIAGLSRLALKHKICLHVDCCLGSFLVPFMLRAGFSCPPFDFRLPGVTSISCDTHKYGFAPKGNSVVMYRNRELRAYQYFITATWPGGVYASPSIAGSRPGSLIAGTWVTLLKNGLDGYTKSCQEIVSTARYLARTIKDDFAPDLYVLGEPLVSVVSFGSKTIDIYEVADAMGALGWHLNALQDPPAVHIACTKPTVAAKDKFLRDLREAVNSVKLRGSKEAKGDTAALYGVAGSLPNKSVVNRMAEGFIDLLYKA